MPLPDNSAAGSLFTQQKDFGIAFRLRAGPKQIRRQKHHPAEESHNTQRNCSTGELVTPSHPDTRKPQKSHKIEVELARPSHFSDVGEKYGKKIPSMIAANKERVSGQA